MEHAWVNIRDPNKYLVVEKIVETRERQKEVSRQFREGQKIDFYDFKSEIFASDNEDDDTFPQIDTPYFVNMGVLVVRNDFMQVLTQFDTGVSEWSKVKINHELDIYPQDYYYLNIRNFKTVLDPENSGNSLRLTHPHLYDDRYKLSSKQTTDSIALTRQALEGPDIWFESTLTYHFFISGRLHEALSEIGLQPHLDMLRCRVLEAE